MPEQNAARDQLAALIDEHSFQAPSYSVEAADAVLAAGWRPPARRIESAAELDALPGRSIVIGNDTPWPEAWQLTSHSGYPRAGANWGSPCQHDEDRITSQELLDRVGSVTLLHTPSDEEHGRG